MADHPAERVAAMPAPQQNTQTHLYQGPIPPPEFMERYEHVLPGSADRILLMAEKQSAHRQRLETRALSGDLMKAMMGTVLAYITFGGSMYGAAFLLLHDKPIESLAALVTALGAAFGPRVYNDFVKPAPDTPATPLTSQ